MKKIMNKKSILLAVSMALVLSLSVGVAFAYFSDYTEAKGGAVLSLGGKTEIEEKVDNDQKTVTIKNTGETNIVVRVMIVGPTQMQVNPSDGWESNGDYYYYKKILKPGKDGNGDVTTPIIANTGDYPAGTDLGDSYQIVVTHESAQPTYDSNNKVEKPEGWDYIPSISAE